MLLQTGFQPILESLKSFLWLPNFWEKSSLLPKVERWQDERSAENYNGLPHSTDTSFLRSCYLVGFNKKSVICSNLWKCKGFLGCKSFKGIKLALIWCCYCCFVSYWSFEANIAVYRALDNETDKGCENYNHSQNCLARNLTRALTDSLLLFFHRHPSGWRMFPDRP